MFFRCVRGPDPNGGGSIHCGPTQLDTIDAVDLDHRRAIVLLESFDDLSSIGPVAASDPSGHTKVTTRHATREVATRDQAEPSQESDQAVGHHVETSTAGGVL